MQNTYTQHDDSAILIHSQRPTYEEKQDPTFITEDCNSDIWEDTYDEADEGAEQERIKRIYAREQIFIDSIEAESAEPPDDSDEESEPEQAQLKRDLQRQALKRIEDAARTQKDFENVIAWWDRLDANRQRKERYHEICRSGDDLPLDYGASENGVHFPDTLNHALLVMERKGDFTDSIFYCPLDIHQLVTEEYMSKILRNLPDEYKFLLSFWALRQLSSAQIADIRGQSDRNIRKVRNTMLKKIRKKLLPALSEKAHHRSLTLTEKRFLAENGGMNL